MRLRSEPLWALSLYPEAGEGGGCLWVRRLAVPSGGPPNVERAAEEAARRARTKIRRYAAANRLNRLGTLTYRAEGCHDPLVLRRHLAEFFRELLNRVGSTGSSPLKSAAGKVLQMATALAGRTPGGPSTNSSCPRASRAALSADVRTYFGPGLRPPPP